MRKYICLIVLLFGFGWIGMLVSCSPGKKELESKLSTDVDDQKDAFLNLTFSMLRTMPDSALLMLDSAKRWINEGTELELKLINVIGTYFWYQGQYDSAIYYYRISYSKSLEYGNKERQLVSISNIGALYNNLSYNDSVILYLNKGLVLAEELNDTDQKAKIYFDLAMLYTRLDFNQNALEYIQKVEDHYINMGDSMKLAYYYSVRATVYQNLDNFEMSRKYSFKAIELCKNPKRSFFLCNLYNNLGVAYWQVKEDYDSSRVYLQKAYSLHSDKTKSTNSYLTTIINLGGMELKAQNYTLGLRYLQKALRINLTYEDEYRAGAINVNMGMAYLGLQKLDSAKYYLNRGLELSLKSGAQEFSQNAYSGLYKLETLQENYQSASKYQDKFYEISDSISSENVKNRIAELEIIHETAKKDRENQFLQNENQLNEALIHKQKIVYSIIIISLILLLVFMGLLLSNKMKLRVLNEELIKKNTEVSEKNSIIEEKNVNLEKQTDQLISLNQTKDKFFSIISHDLRGPFNSLLGLLEILEEDFNDLNDAEKLKIIKRLHSNSRNTYNLLVNLLEWSRTQRGHITPDFLSIPLYNSAQSSITFLRQRINDKKHVIINKIDEDIRVIADVNLLLSVFTNLINNAVKFTPDGGNIIVSAKRIGVNVEMEINDNGIGIPEDQLDKLFSIDTSFSRKGTNDELGTGLGLLTCKEFVYLMNGTCRVESKEGKGTSFFIQLKSA
ncbi:MULTISPECIES: ATP-binding protein [unclassified Lentimicrobium]|uniref:tetratricopeptide repeat-containing sensor histidine kinase n=1 Tax=unclassified Lentimicrobium TaxID=2677434 RepID=UPI0015563A86|nr:MULTISPECIES: ATP-binding protein [unclassified Lentimicrobium]NPD44797.1 hypothetical protein [Lentimicrobium sp. S6]NPD83186.1 hypothetical protein [Lentimicrobium sp. L6]